MKLIISLILVLFTINLNAKDLPEIPEDCFDEGFYCSESAIVKHKVNGRERNVVYAAVFAVLTRDQMDELGLETTRDIETKFLDFDQWDEYVSEYDMNDNKHVKEFKKSIKIESARAADGSELPRHYASYVTKAPGIIGGRLRVREVTEYTYTSDFEEAPDSLYYRTVMDETFNISGEKELVGAEGIKYKTGTVSLRHDEDEDLFYIYYTMYTVPGIDFAINTSMPYIRKPIVDILVGMFYLPFNDYDYNK